MHKLITSCNTNSSLNSLINVIKLLKQIKYSTQLDYDYRDYSKPHASLLKASASFVSLFCGRIIGQLIIYEYRRSMLRMITLLFQVFLFFLISHVILVVVGGCQYIYQGGGDNGSLLIDKKSPIKTILLDQFVYWVKPCNPFNKLVMLDHAHVNLF